MNKFLVVDGSSMLTTNYFATLPRSIMFEKDEEKKKEHYHEIMHAEDGTYTNAIYGTLKMLKKIIENQKPTHLAVVFDQTRNTFRRELYKDYKGTRSETQEPLKQQFVLIEQILEEIGIQTLYSSDYEADDYAGSLVETFESPETTMYLLTKDHDYIQLVSEYTRLWMMYTKKEACDELVEKYYGFWNPDIELNLPDKTFEYTPELIKEEFQLESKQIIDLKAISGDKSDNIPGIAGISDKSAIPLLNEYGTIENLYSHIEHIDISDAKALKEINTFWKELGVSRSPIKLLLQTDPEKLVGKEAAMLSKQLATIKRDISINKSIEEFETKLNYDKLQEVCNRLNIKKL